ncbi:MAG: ATP-binding protein [Gammaproteobacteria bacterium]
MDNKLRQSSLKNNSQQRLFTCIFVLFILLSALGASSYWLIHAEQQIAIATTVHILILISAFFLVAYIASRNQKLQKEEVDQRNHVQNILYEVAASINTCRDLSELLNRFCEAVYSELSTKSISIWLITDQDTLEYITSCGIPPDQTSPHKRIDIEQDIQQLLTENKIILAKDELSTNLLSDPSVNYCFQVPLHHHSRTLGVLNFELSSLPFKPSYLQELMITLGNHLSMAIEKARLDQESRRMLIMQERSLIANEMHDSLAQTLASLRFQVRVLDETLQPTSEFKAIRGIEQVENSLDEAYTDLRELIAHCRTPINKQGLLPAIEKLISRFRKETGIHVLFQKEWQHSALPPNMEMHIFRIIQEAMNNIRKHSGANHVRVMFRCDDRGNHHILIENDGIGFETPKSSDHPGKHLGLTIMQERAAHLGGHLRIESEPEEGTRIELQFTYNNESQNDPLQRLSGMSR